VANLKIILLRQHYEKLLTLARKSRPIESCAILIGLVEDDNVKVADIFPVKNINESPTSFSVSPEDIYRVYKAAEEKKMDIIAIFHSHTASSYPSEKDLNGMTKWPIIWLIMGFDGMRAFKLVNGHELVEVEISIVDEP